MKQFLLSVILLLLASTVLSQTRTVDSLQKVLLTQKEDTNKVKTLLNLETNIRAQNKPVEARKYGKEALALSEKLHFMRGKAWAFSSIAHTYTVEWNFQEALNYYKLAYDASTEIGNKWGIAGSLIYMGTAYSGLRNYPAAFEHYQQALKHFEALKNNWGIAETNSHIGGIYFRQENYPESIKYRYIALKYYESFNNKERIAGTFQSIGAAYYAQGNYQDALKNFLASIKINKEIGNKIGFGQTSFSIGRIYTQQRKYSEALKILEEAVSIFKEPNMPYWGLSNAYGHIGEAYEQQGDEAKNKFDANRMFTQALQNYNEAIKAVENTVDKQSIGYVSILIGRTYLKLNNPSKSRAFLERGIELSKEVNNKDNLMKGYFALSKLDSIEGNYKNSYEHYKSYIIYRDSLENNESVRKTTQVKLQYEFDKKEDSLKLQQQITNEKLKQQQLLAVQQKQKLEIEEASLKLSNQQKKLNYLALLKTKIKLEEEQSDRQSKEKQLKIARQEKALEHANLKLKTNEVLSQEKEIEAKRMERNIIIAASLVILVLGAALWRNTQRRQRAYSLLEKQQMRTQIARDFHDDIGSELTSISFYSEMVKMQVPEESVTVKNTLEKIGNNARTIVNTMNDIVWVINPDNDVTENLIRRMRNHGNELCNSRNIDYHFDTDDETKDLKLNMQQRKNLYLIYKEALNNAVKYADCSRIDIKLSQTEHELQLMVKDDGRGFDVRSVKEGNGLTNMKRRAEEIEAMLAVEAQPNNGACMSLKLKIT